jgi:hypothetical protein
MNNAPEIGSDAMLYMQNFINTGSRIGSVDERRVSQPQRQHGDDNLMTLTKRKRCPQS